MLFQLVGEVLQKSSSVIHSTLGELKLCLYLMLFKAWKIREHSGAARQNRDICEI